jgi:hypothetical protein
VNSSDPEGSSVSEIEQIAIKKLNEHEKRKQNEQIAIKKLNEHKTRDQN